MAREFPRPIILTCNLHAGFLSICMCGCDRVWTAILRHCQEGGFFSRFRENVVRRALNEYKSTLCTTAYAKGQKYHRTQCLRALIWWCTIALDWLGGAQCTRALTRWCTMYSRTDLVVHNVPAYWLGGAQCTHTLTRWCTMYPHTDSMVHNVLGNNCPPVINDALYLSTLNFTVK